MKLPRYSDEERLAKQTGNHMRLKTHVNGNGPGGI